MIASSTIQKSMLTLLVLAACGLTACDDTPPTAASDGTAMEAHMAATAGQAATDRIAENARVQRQLAELRRATAGFHRPAQAEAAGYTVLVTHPESGAACFEDAELGGMGRHLLNPALMDGEVRISDPEALIYEPGPNGQLRLVGVEYVIPFDIRGMDEAPPVLFGQAFKQNFTFGLWALHVWPWRHNPAGMFADWNPKVSCRHDGHVAP